MDFTKIGIFHGRRPISRKMSRPWKRELSWSLEIDQDNLQTGTAKALAPFMSFAQIAFFHFYF